MPSAKRKDFEWRPIDSTVLFFGGGSPCMKNTLPHLSFAWWDEKLFVANCCLAALFFHIMNLLADTGSHAANGLGTESMLVWGKY